MDFNDFGEITEDSAIFLKEKLKDLHPWDEEWDLKITRQLVPFYAEQMEIMKIEMEIQDSQFTIETFNNIIKFSSILSKDQLKILFMEALSNIPLIVDDKYLKEDERIDLLIESNPRLRKVNANLYLFFNHEDL